MSSKRLLKSIGIYALILALVAFTAFIGGLLIVNSQKDIKGKITIDAEVRSLVKESRYNSANKTYVDLYAEVVVYTVDGEEYTAANTTFSNTPTRIGQKIKIAYDPQDPSNCVFVESNGLFIFAPFIFCGFFVLVGIGKIISDIKRKYREEDL